MPCSSTRASLSRPSRSRVSSRLHRRRKRPQGRDRVRVTVQLIDGETETHLGRAPAIAKLEDIFAIQDEITAFIASTLFGRVEAARHDRVKRKTTANGGGLRIRLGRQDPPPQVEPRGERRGSSCARSRYRARSKLCAHAHAWMACVSGQAWLNGWCDDRSAFEQRIIDELQIALALDDNDADVHRILAALKLNFNEHDKAAYHQERAEPQPQQRSHRRAAGRGTHLAWPPAGGNRVGPAGDAAQSVSSGALLEPSRPCAIFSPRFCRRDRILQQAYRARPHAPRFLAASSAQLGNRTAAGAHAREVLQREPAFTAWSLRRHAALSKPNRCGARARGAAEGGVADQGRSEKLWTT